MSIKGDSTVGKIVDPRNQAYVEWEIPRYFSMSQKADAFITSPVFHFAKEAWCLKIYPNGERKEKSVGWVSLALENMSLKDKSLFMNLTLGVKFSNGEMRKCLPTNAEFTEKDYMYIVTKLIDKDVLLKCQNFASDCVLTLFCNLKLNSPEIDKNESSLNESTHNESSLSESSLNESTHNESSLNESSLNESSQMTSAYGTSTLIRDLTTLLHSERKSDVIFRVKDETFHVHKLILGARSPVFAAMFEHNMKENSTGEVNIEDCDADIFGDFLSFIYTGTIREISPKIFSQLFMLSDKYNLSDLKEMCIEFMKKNLCLDIVCEVMYIADSHDLEELKASAKKLIVSNIKTLLFTEQWLSFMRNNPPLAAELLTTVIPDSKSL